MHGGALGHPGYEGEADTITVPIKKPQGGKPTGEQRPSTMLTPAHAPPASVATRY
jgi:hypothetical protein